MRTARGILVQIGVPARSARNLEPVSEGRAQYPVVAGAGNVNEVRLEALDRLDDEREMTQVGGIETQVFLNRNCEKAARKLQRPDVPGLFERLGALACPYAQER